jgi:hypothetical protein
MKYIACLMGLAGILALTGCTVESDYGRGGYGDGYYHGGGYGHRYVEDRDYRHHDYYDGRYHDHDWDHHW